MAACILFFFSFFFFSIVNLQCCASFRCIAKWLNYTYTYLLSRFYSHINYHRMLSSLCYTSSSLLVIYLIYRCVHVFIPSSWFIPPLSTLITISLFLISVSLFLFCKSAHLLLFSLLISVRFHIRMIPYDICLSLSGWLSMIIFRAIYVAANDIISSFLWLSNRPLYIHATSSLPVPPSVDI